MARLIFSKHAAFQMKRREIKESDVIKVLEQPHIIYPSNKVRNAKRLVRRLNGKAIFVVALYKKNLILVITAGWRQ